MHEIEIKIDDYKARWSLCRAENLLHVFVKVQCVGLQTVYGQIFKIVFFIMFSFVYSRLKLPILVFLFP